MNWFLFDILRKLFMIAQSIDIPKKMLKLGNITPVTVTETFDFKQKKNNSWRQSQLSLSPGIFFLLRTGEARFYRVEFKRKTFFSGLENI